MQLRSTLLALVSSLFVISTSAHSSEDFTTWRLSIDSIGFDNTKTAPSGVADDSIGLGLAIDMKRGLLVGGFGMYAGSLDDSNGFSQTVEDQFGNISEADSTVSAISFFAEVGASYTVFNNTYAEVLAGYQTMSVSRSIANCSDCASDDIPVDGGLYLKPRIKYALTDKYLLSAAYTSFLSGDVTSGILIGFEGRF